MASKGLKQLAKVDYVLVTSVLILVILGSAMVYSASSFRAEQAFGNSSYFFQKQVSRAALGLFVMVLVAAVDYRRWLGLSPFFYVIAFFLLVLLFTQLPFVRTMNGATRWMRIGPIQFQPSDLARYALILVLARLLYSQRKTLDDMWGGFVKILILVLTIIVPIAAEPDLGTSALLLITAFCMFFFAQVPMRYLLASGLTLVTSGLIFMRFQNYQQGRIHSFIEFIQGGDPGWQVKQSLISIADGGWFGKGFGGGQQKYDFLPEPHKDFIFSVIGEELGFMGAALVLVLFFIIIYRGVRIARFAPTGYGSLLAAGITVNIGLYAFINAAVALALIPTTGIPLPFVSYGGTALVVNLAAVGLLINISMQGSPYRVNQPTWRVYDKRLKRPAFTRSFIR